MAGKIFTVFGPRGGSGKTMLAVNLAVSLARLRPERVSLVDLSLTFGHCALFLNLEPRVSLARMPSEDLGQLDEEELNRLLDTHSSTLKVFSGSLRPEEGEAVTGDHVRGALGALKLAYDAVIVDTGSLFTEPTIAALEASDRVILICTPEMSTLRDVGQCQRIFTDLIGIARDKVHYVMNNPYPFQPVATEQFSQAIEQAIHFEIPFGNDVPAKAATNGEAFTQTQSGSSVARAVERIARELNDEAGPVPERVGERRGLFGLR